MSTETNKAIVRRLFTEALSKGNMDIIDELFAPDHVSHSVPPEMSDGVEGVKLFTQYFRNAFPDGEHAIHDQIAEGDKVVTRVSLTGTHLGEYMGIPATGRTMTIDGVVITQFLDGKFIETWAIYDDLMALKQLGGVPN